MTGRPSDLYELSPEELSRAMRLGARLHEEAVAGAAREDAIAEVQDHQAYVAQAIATILSERTGDRRPAMMRRSVLVGLCLVAIGGALIALRASIRNASNVNSPPVAARTAAPADIAIVLPPPGDRLLSPVPIPSGVALKIRSSPTGDWTVVTFDNRRADTVTMKWFDYRGVPKPYFRLAPGQTVRIANQFNQPLLAVAESGETIGLFYPPGYPSIARLEEAQAGPPAGPLHGYLSSMPASQFRSSGAIAAAWAARPKSIDRITGQWTAIVNLTRETVNEFEVGPDGQSGWVCAIPSGSAQVGHLYYGTACYITDRRNHVLAVYDAPPVDQAAIILPARADAGAAR